VQLTVRFRIEKESRSDSLVDLVYDFVKPGRLLNDHLYEDQAEDGDGDDDVYEAEERQDDEGSRGKPIKGRDGISKEAVLFLCCGRRRWG